MEKLLTVYVFGIVVEPLAQKSADVVEKEESDFVANHASFVVVEKRSAEANHASDEVVAQRFCVDSQKATDVVEKKKPLSKDDMR